MVSLSSLGLSRKLNTNFSKATARVAQALERLGSGNRLNSPADGAVDYAKFKDLQAQSRGLGQILGNVDDVRSLTEKADSTLSAMMQMAYDLRELAQRASDEGLTEDEREDLQSQAQSILNDFSAYAADTSYNTLKLLDGSFGTKSFQSGLNSQNQFEFSIGDARPSILGRLAVLESGALFNDAYVGDGTSYVKINGIFVSAGGDDGISTNYADRSAISRATAINSISNKTGVFAEAYGIATDLAFSFSGSTFTETLEAGDFVINGVSITGASIDSAAALVNAVNNSSSETGVIATVIDDGTISFEPVDGRNLQIQVSNASGNNFYDLIDLSANEGPFQGDADDFSMGLDGTFISGIRLWSSESITINSSTAKVVGLLTRGTTNVSGATALQAVNLETAESAEDAIKTLDATVAQISSLRANVTAIHSRLDMSASKLLQDINVTDEAAQNLGGTDFAVETANLVYNQLIQDSALASMIQANISRVTVSKLLGDL